MLTRLWIRADGSRSVGLGHLSRTTALAEAAGRQGTIPVYATSRDELARHFLEGRQLETVWLAESSDGSWLAEVRAGDAILFDRYDITATEVVEARSTGASVSLLVDGGKPSLPVDLVVNPNSDFDATALPASTRWVAGPKFALVRSAFRNRRRLRAGSRETLVVIMGGSDPYQQADHLIELLGDSVPFQRVVLVEGPGADPAHICRPWLSTVRDPEEIADVFDTADAAITAGGSSCWELLSMGVPTAVVAVSENQRCVAETACAAGAALRLARASTAHNVHGIAQRLADPKVQLLLSTAAMGLVDGLGPARVLRHIERIAARR